MKKLMLLALVAVVSIVSNGCQRPWFSRGASANTCPQSQPDCHTGGAVIHQGYAAPGDGQYIGNALPQPGV